MTVMTVKYSKTVTNN